MTKWLLIFVTNMSPGGYLQYGPSLYDSHAECVAEQHQYIRQYQDKHPGEIIYTECLHVVLDYEWDE